MSICCCCESIAHCEKSCCCRLEPLNPGTDAIDVICCVSMDCCIATAYIQQDEIITRITLELITNCLAWSCEAICCAIVCGSGEDAPRFDEDAPRFDEDAPRFNEDAPRLDEDAPRCNEDAPRFDDDAPPPIPTAPPPAPSAAVAAAVAAGFGDVLGDATHSTFSDRSAIVSARSPDESMTT